MVKLVIASVISLGLLTGCGDAQGTNWGKLNPVGVTVYEERGDNSPGDTTINLDIDSGTSCGECTEEDAGVGKNCVSIPSETPLPWEECVQFGGPHKCTCT